MWKQEKLMTNAYKYIGPTQQTDIEIDHICIFSSMRKVQSKDFDFSRGIHYSFWKFNKFKFVLKNSVLK